MPGICVASPAIVKAVPRGRSRNSARSSSFSLCVSVRVLIDVSKGTFGPLCYESSRRTVCLLKKSLLQQERFFGIGQRCTAKSIDCDSIKDEHGPPYQ